MDLVCYGPRALCTLTVELPSRTIYVMTLGRTTAGINKAEDAGRMDAQIGFADALQRVFPTALARYLLFRGGIRQGILCEPSSVTFDLRQCG